ncbi:MAG: NADP-dependent oxidoreductase [Dehalococcoidia bacterium]|nr:NADP-dependent oxidoreductase [Dehalococcoidia bacterium]
MTENLQVFIANVPSGPLQVSDFELRRSPAPACGPGEVLCRTLAITIGAGQRAGLQGSASYAGAPRSGVVMGGTGLARVEVSNAEGFVPGDVVVGPTGWQELSVQKPAALRKVEPGVDSIHYLGILGGNGMTAYFGLLDLGKPRPGETVVVSAAAGSVGHMAGQIAKLQGSRVVGVAGSEEKCEILTRELGFDAAVNYKTPDFRAAFKAATPDRIDVYFDNTGGDILESALFRMNTHGRIVCCGVVSQYDTTNPGPGPRGVPGLLVNNRVRMEGFLVFDYAARFDEARREIAGWITSGKLQARITEYHGLGEAPGAFVGLLAGKNIGTTVIRVA